MKILHAVESYYPSVSGAPEVVRHLSECMVRLGHDVTVVTRKLPQRKSLTHNGVKIVEFNIRPTSDQGMSTVTGLAGDTKKYQNFLLKNESGIIMTYAAQQWTTDLMLPILDKISAKKVIVPCGYSALYNPQYKQYFKDLPGYLSKFDASVYLSPDYRDINFARQHKLKSIHIIPNGADETEFSSRLSSKRKAKLKAKYGLNGLVIMTLANCTGEKGHQELLWVFKRLPVARATLISASTIMPGLGWYDIFETQAKRINQSRKFPGKKVVMVDGSQRQEVVDLLKSADIFVFLSNIEASPLVLFEAAAAGVPFVATAAGNSAEIARWTGGGVIVKSYDRPNGRVVADLKDALWQVTKLALNRRRRQAIGRAGHEAWKKKFTWEKLAQDYLKLYESLLKDSKK